jgi:hypothetical protein
MVKTKRTFARTAVLASAALALSARGADAAKAFQAGGAANDLFAPGVTTLDCSLLYFDTNTGALMSYNSASTTAGAAHGLAVDDTTGGAAPTDINECKTAPGYYLHTAAGGTLAADDTNADGLKVFHSHPGWYAAGGQNFVNGIAVAEVPWNLASTTPNVGSSTVDECAAGTTSHPGAKFCGIVAAGYYGAAGAFTAPDYTGHAGTVTACSTTFSGATAAGITSDQLTTGTTDKTACKTASGYIITSAVGAADTAITVAQAAAGKYAAGGTPLVTANAATSGTATETASTCAAGTYSAAGASSCSTCATGTTSNAGAEFCGIVAAGYYGAAGAGTAPSYTSAASSVTACSATFSGATAAGITSTQTTTGTTTKTACETAPGYIITSAVGATDSQITVAQAAAGKYAAGYTSLVTANAATSGTAAETASTCAANTYSAAGAASCTACPTGQTSAAGASACTAASPTAESAGASTPIAVALAAAAAVPLLL